MARGWILGVGGLVLLAGLGFGGWTWRQKQERRAVLRTLGAYERALKKGDLAALRSVLDEAKGQELAGPGADAKVALLAGLRPADGAVAGVELGWSRASVSLQAKEAKGVVEFVRQGGAWRVAKESWKVDLGGPSLPPARTPRKVQALLDRMAGPDPRDGGTAWAELGAAYTNPDLFFEDVRGAFDDRRPIAFRVEWVSNVYGGQRYSGYSTKNEPIGSGPSEAHSVGEVLRMDMYRMEGAGLGENPKPFAPWWAAYRKARGLGAGPGPDAAPGSAPGGLGEPQATVTMTLGDAATKTKDSPLTGDLSADYKDPKIPGRGEAWGTLDDRPVKFLLATGFGSETRFDHPKRGVLDFRVPGSKKGDNPRRLQLVFDATRAGDHDLGNGEATLKFIEDGGQVFPPRTGGVLRLNTAYGDGKLDGEIPEIQIHSAGITHRLQLRFTVEGSLTARK